MLTNFVGDIKQQMFYQFWKFKLDTLIILQFIIENNLYGMVTRRSLRGVPWRSTTSLLFKVTLYILIHFWLGTQKSNTNLNNLLFMNIKLDELLSEISNVLQKRRVYLNHVSMIRLNSSDFPTFTQRYVKRNVTMQRND